MGYCVSNIRRFDQVKCITNTSRTFPHDKIKIGDVLKVADTLNDYFNGVYLYFIIDGEKVGAIATMFEAINEERYSNII